MEKISQKDIDWLLQDKDAFNFYRTPDPVEEKPVKNAPFKKVATKAVLWFLMVIGLGILPFFILVRTAVFLNLDKDLNGWVSLIGGIIACTLFLGGYILFLFRKVKKKKLLMQFGLGGIGVLVGGFCIYGLLYLSSVNAKSDSVRDVYRSLHPILRVAVATTTLADKELVITDIQRTREDYISWGLTPLESSMHYEQEDGFVHAIDLRTIGHSEFRNKLLEHSLRVIGLQTIRHVGTADHLHVALKNYGP
jgi:hypothetical protein